MSVVKSIRTRFEQLLTGDYSINSTYAIMPDRFVILPANQQVAPDYNKERSCTVVVMPPLPLLPLNMCNTLALFTAKMTVAITYPITNRGNDDSEDETVTGGEFTRDAVQARMATDSLEILRVFSWSENVAGLTPTVCGCAISSNGIQSALTPKDGTLIMEFLLTLEINTQTNYALSGN